MKQLAPLIALALLSGCSLLGSKTPPQLLTLTTSAPLAADTQRTASAGNTLTVLVPSAAAAVAGTRVPVYDGGIAVAYVKDAVWVDAPARQLQRLLGETIAARSERVVLDPRQSTVDPGTRVSGSLVRFGIDAATNEAVVTFDAQLVRDAGSVVTRRFEARAPVAAIDALNAATSLNQAANAVAVQVADWVR